MGLTVVVLRSPYRIGGVSYTRDGSSVRAQMKELSLGPSCVNLPASASMPMCAQEVSPRSLFGQPALPGVFAASTTSAGPPLIHHVRAPSPQPCHRRRSPSPARPTRVAAAVAEPARECQCDGRGSKHAGQHESGTRVDAVQVHGSRVRVAGARQSNEARGQSQHARQGNARAGGQPGELPERRGWWQEGWDWWVRVVASQSAGVGGTGSWAVASGTLEDGAECWRRPEAEWCHLSSPDWLVTFSGDSSFYN